MSQRSVHLVKLWFTGDQVAVDEIVFAAFPFAGTWPVHSITLFGFQFCVHISIDGGQCGPGDGDGMLSLAICFPTATLYSIHI